MQHDSRLRPRLVAQVCFVGDSVSSAPTPTTARGSTRSTRRWPTCKLWDRQGLHGGGRAFDGGWQAAGLLTAPHGAARGIRPKSARLEPLRRPHPLANGRGRVEWLLRPHISHEGSNLSNGSHQEGELLARIERDRDLLIDFFRKFIRCASPTPAGRHAARGQAYPEFPRTARRALSRSSRRTRSRPNIVATFEADGIRRSTGTSTCSRSAMARDGAPLGRRFPSSRPGESEHREISGVRFAGLALLPGALEPGFAWNTATTF